MATSFKELKKNRKSNLDKLIKEIEKTGKKEYGDDRFWKLDHDKSGNGYAVIRFLPAPEGEDLPWVKFYSHSFKGPTGLWYIENSLTTLNKADPVSDLNRVLWNEGQEDLVRKERKRKVNYVSNILVIEDKKHPECEGKVFLFRYGVKIWTKLQEAMHPEFEDEEPIDPFDFWAGANFKLKMKKVEGYLNYDSSSFDKPSAVFADDAKIEALWKQEYPLAQFVAPDQFKTYEELQEKLDQVLSKAPARGTGNGGSKPKAAKKLPVEDEVEEEAAIEEEEVETEEQLESDTDDDNVDLDTDDVEKYIEGLSDDD